jgi:hypothetical protein
MVNLNWVPSAVYAISQERDGQKRRRMLLGLFIFIGLAIGGSVPTGLAQKSRNGYSGVTIPQPAMAFSPAYTAPVQVQQLNRMNQQNLANLTALSQQLNRMNQQNLANLTALTQQMNRTNQQNFANLAAFP